MSHKRRSVPRQVSRLLFFDGPGINNFDTALHNGVPITEKLSLQFRAGFFDTFDRAQFLPPVGNCAARNFGHVTGANAPRFGQGALGIAF